MWIKRLLRIRESNLDRETEHERSIAVHDLSLQRCYRTVLVAFFPQWTDASRWRVTLVQNRPWAFRCDRRRHQILVCTSSFPDRDDLRASLIQLVAYAMSSGRPGEEWAEIMQQAIVTARRLNRGGLAQRIDTIAQAAWIDELEVYYDPTKQTVTCYDGNALLEVTEDDIPQGISFEDSLRFSVLEREIRREEAELKARRDRRRESA